MNARHAFTNELIWDNEMPISDNKIQTFKSNIKRNQFAFVITYLHEMALIAIYSNHQNKKIKYPSNVCPSKNQYSTKSVNS